MLSLVKSFESFHGIVTGSPRLPYWRVLEKTQFFPKEKLFDIQKKRLIELIDYVWENNIFYRDRFEKAGLKPGDIKTPSDLQKVPVLTKSTVRLGDDLMLSRGFEIDKLQVAKTGGSTGKSLRLYYTEECSELRNACARRHDRWAGWNPGEPIAACWGNPKLPSSFKEKLKLSLLQPYIFLDTMNVNQASVEFFLEEWRKRKPTLLYGHAHSIFLLAEFIRIYEFEAPKPKGILSTSMMLLPSERKVIEDVFGVKVTDRYGCEEVSLIASECEKHNGMHLNIEHLVIEFLREDGTPASPGEPGKIVVTDLMNKAMPFIRYQVEDVGVPSDRVCSCGRGLPLMDQVTGRIADFLIKSDGSKVAGISLIENTLTHFEGINQMQIVQKSLRLIELNLVCGYGYSDRTSWELKEYFRQVFGGNITIKLKYVDQILPESSGKYRFSICLVGH